MVYTSPTQQHFNITWHKVFGLCFLLPIVQCEPGLTTRQLNADGTMNASNQLINWLSVAIVPHTQSSRVFGIFLGNVPTNCLALFISLIPAVLSFYSVKFCCILISFMLIFSFQT